MDIFKYCFNNYINLTENECYNIFNNSLFMYLINNCLIHTTFDEIPCNVKNDLLVQELLRLNDGEMIYVVNANSVEKIKNKIIYLLSKQVNFHANNVWNKNIDKAINYL